MTEVKPWLRVAGYAVHAYTASGVVFAFLAAAEVAKSEPDPRRTFLWLIVAVLIDATDGPLARLVHVKTSAPKINGRTIDDIVDFLTFTFIPLLMIAKLEWVPQPTLVFIAPPLIASILGFANVAAKDESGGFFLGFPSYWNIVALYAGIAAAQGMELLNGIALLLLAVLTLIPVGFIYPNLAPLRWRSSILGGAVVWLALLVAMVYYYPTPPESLLAASLVYPAFYTVVSFVTFVKHRRE